MDDTGKLKEFVDKMMEEDSIIMDHLKNAEDREHSAKVELIQQIQDILSIAIKQGSK